MICAEVLDDRIDFGDTEQNVSVDGNYGAYANRLRQTHRELTRPDSDARPAPSRRARNKRWAELIYRIYEVDPLICNRCGGQMKILAFITEPTLIRTIRLIGTGYKCQSVRAK